MTENWLLTLPKRVCGCGGSRTRLPRHPTCSLAGRFAPCLTCERPGWPIGPARAGLGLNFLLRRAARSAPSVSSH